jgi:hypothetical protein
MGAGVAERQIALEKWCMKYSQNIRMAGVSAMEIMRDRERAGETQVQPPIRLLMHGTICRICRKPRLSSISRCYFDPCSGQAQVQTLG